MRFTLSIPVPDSLVKLAGAATAVVSEKLDAAKAGTVRLAGQAADTAAAAYRDASDTTSQVLRQTGDDIATAYRETAIAGVPLSQVVNTGAGAVSHAATAVAALEVKGRPLSDHAAALGESVKTAARDVILRGTSGLRSQQEIEQDEKWRANATRILQDGVTLNQGDKSPAIAYIVTTFLASESVGERDQDRALVTLSVLRDAYARKEISADDYKRILMDFDESARNDLPAAKALARAHLYAVRRGKVPV